MVTMTLEEMIQQMVKNGVSTEDIAKKTQDTLNGIEKVEKEKREKEKARDEERRAHLHELEKSMMERLEKSDYCLCDVGTLTALVMASSHPQWTVDDVDTFIENVNKNVKVLGELDKDLKKVFDAFKSEVKTCNKCKQEEKGKHNRYDSPGEAFLDWVLDMLDM